VGVIFEEEKGKIAHGHESPGSESLSWLGQWIVKKYPAGTVSFESVSGDTKINWHL
jgi:hypothetical protein